MTDYWMRLPFLIMIEMMQLEEEGCDTAAYKAQAAAFNDQSSTAEMLAFYDDLSTLAPTADFPFSEPSDLEGIRAARPANRQEIKMDLSDEALQDRILGAWLGRSAGCTLGKPVEGLTRNQIQTYLKAAGAYPLTGYVPLIDPLPEGVELHPSYPDTVKGKISYMSRDDDTDYTILGLHILEKYGPNFTSKDVGEAWLDSLPYHMVFTAERIAYRNLVNEIPVPEAARTRNPFREWIGAQIRADGFAYAAAGMPEAAAELAFRDASVSHVKNGIYGEMFTAALISAAFATDDIHALIQVGLGQIPETSRFAAMVRQVLAWSQENADWETTWDFIARTYGKYFWAHTINNAAVVLLSLLYGQGDLEKSITIAVMSGWDTDCNGATVGSIIGAMHGVKTLDGAWVSPLNNVMHSAIMGFDGSRITDLAQRSWQTHQMMRKAISHERA